MYRRILNFQMHSLFMSNKKKITLLKNKFDHANLKKKSIRKKFIRPKKNIFVNQKALIQTIHTSFLTTQ